MATPADVTDLFVDAFGLARTDFRLQRLRGVGKTTIIQGDARDAVSRVGREIDVALFSPPYPNSFDYTDIYNLELWVLGYLRTASDNRQLRLQTVRSHVQIRHDAPLNASLSPTLLRILRNLRAKSDDLWNPRIPAMIQGYFEDLELIISRLATQMDSGGHIACVVGDSLYANVLVDVPTVLAEIFDHGHVRFASTKTLRKMSASAQHDWRRSLKESLVRFEVSPREQR